MNELEARRQLLANPHRVSPELEAALMGNETLASLRRELLANDEALRRVLTEIPVPDGLSDRIVLRARYGGRSRLRLAIAATWIAIAAGVSIFMVADRPDREQSRELAMIEHVATSAEESAHRGPIEPAAFRASVQALGVKVRAGNYRVAQLGRCVIAGVEARHFIVETARGPASYVILPGATQDPVGERLLERFGLDGLFVRRAGATIGVFAPRGTPRSELRSRLSDVIG